MERLQDVPKKRVSEMPTKGQNPVCNKEFGQLIMPSRSDELQRSEHTSNLGQRCVEGVLGTSHQFK